MGVENMIMNTFMEPDLVKSMSAKVTPLVSSIQRRMVDAGATVMWMADPTSSEDLISPDMFAEYSAGAIKQVIGDMKAENSDIPAFIHICGNTLNTMTQLPATGADCLSFDHAVDPAAAKKKAGRDLALMGNIDPVHEMMSGTPESIREERYRILDQAGQDGGCILAPGCETPISSPDENVLALGRAGREYWTRK